jgi:nucleotide-binding universal stress UspA family protein
MSIQTSDEHLRTDPDPVILGSAVVGACFDGTSRAALEWAVRHVAGDLHVVHAVSPGLELLEASVQILASDVDRATAELAAMIGTIDGDQEGICQHVVEDTVHQALLDTAHRFSVDAIVVGGRDRDRSPHLIGPNTGRLLHLSDVPTVIVPEDWVGSAPAAERDVRDVVIGASGETAEDRFLVEWTCSISDAASRGTVVHAMSRRALARSVRGPSWGDPETEMSDELTGLLPEGWSWDVSVVLDDPLSALMSAATAASLIVIGSHRSSRVAGFMTGAIAHHLPALSSCPIALVPIDLEER